MALKLEFASPVLARDEAAFVAARVSAWIGPIHALTRAATKGLLNSGICGSRNRRREAVEPPIHRLTAAVTSEGALP